MLDYIKSKIRGTMCLKQLIKDGLIVGNNFHAQEGVIIDPGHCWLIEIGNNVTLAPGVHVLAHDASTKIPLGYTKLGKVRIGDNVFIGTGTIILPNVHIGNNVIVGAGSLVSRDLHSNGVYCGNPIKKMEDYDEWVSRQKRTLDNSIVYDDTYKIGTVTSKLKREMRTDLESQKGFIV